MCCFFGLSYYQRVKVIEMYNVKEDDSCCCCGPLNPTLDFFHIHCNYPCSFFQMYVSILEWESPIEAKFVVNASPVGNPVAIGRPVQPS